MSDTTLLYSPRLMLTSRRQHKSAMLPREDMRARDIPQRYCLTYISRYDTGDCYGDVIEILREVEIDITDTYAAAILQLFTISTLRVITMDVTLVGSRQSAYIRYIRRDKRRERSPLYREVV